MRAMKWNFSMVTLLLILGFSSCNNKEEEEPDYRDKWLGTYQCEEYLSVWRMTVDSLGNFGDTTIYYQYQNTVQITAKGDSILQFFVKRNNSSYEAVVRSSGSFTRPPTSYGDLGIGGNFVGDSLYMYISYPHGHASSSSSSFEGKKVKN